MNKLSIDLDWIHFIGIGGVSMAPLAIKFSKLGYRVTGSDLALYEPIKGLLANHRDVKVYQNFSYKNLVDNDCVPGLVVCGSGISLKNKEYLFAKKQGLSIKHFPNILEELVVGSKSIVVAGTYGKTSITASLAFIFRHLGKPVSYMFGGMAVNKGFDSIEFKNHKTLFSIVEGDEYIAARWDKRSKFFYYHPDILVLNSAQLDHVDIFENEAKYLENFKMLVSKMPKKGLIYANFDDLNVKKVVKNAPCKVISYTKVDLEEVIEFHEIHTSLVGEFNKMNIAVASLVANDLGINWDDIAHGLEEFLGIKRRLEVRFPASDVNLSDEKFVIIDDFASSPSKVLGTLKTIRKEFPSHEIWCVFEPNTGSRNSLALEKFAKIFQDVDKLFLFPFAKLVKSDKYIDEIEFHKHIKKLGVDSTHLAQSSDLVEIVVSRNRAKSVVLVFCSSHGMEERIAKCMG